MQGIYRSSPKPLEQPGGRPGCLVEYKKVYFRTFITLKEHEMGQVTMLSGMEEHSKPVRDTLPVMQTPFGQNLN